MITTLLFLTKVINLELTIEFQDDWAEYVKGEEWDTLVRTAIAGLDMKRAQRIKGKGKGEGTGEGKGTFKGSKGTLARARSKGTQSRAGRTRRVQPLDSDG